VVGAAFFAMGAAAILLLSHARDGSSAAPLVRRTLGTRVVTGQIVRAGKPLRPICYPISEALARPRCRPVSKSKSFLAPREGRA